MVVSCVIFFNLTMASYTAVAIQDPLKYYSVLLNFNTI